METRPLAEADLEGFCGLITEIAVENPRAFWFSAKPPREVLTALFRAKLEDMRAAKMVDLVAVEDGRIIGECEIVAGSPGVGYVGILVDSRHRRKGVASGLLADSSKAARGIGLAGLRVDVHRGNDAAMAFFRKSGFSETGAGAGNAEIVTLEKGI